MHGNRLATVVLAALLALAGVGCGDDATTDPAGDQMDEQMEEPMDEEMEEPMDDEMEESMDDSGT